MMSRVEGTHSICSKHDSTVSASHSDQVVNVATKELQTPVRQLKSSPRQSKPETLLAPRDIASTLDPFSLKCSRGGQDAVELCKAVIRNQAVSGHFRNHCTGISVRPMSIIPFPKAITVSECYGMALTTVTRSLPVAKARMVGYSCQLDRKAPKGEDRARQTRIRL